MSPKTNFLYEPLPEPTRNLHCMLGYTLSPLLHLESIHEVPVNQPFLFLPSPRPLYPTKKGRRPQIHFRNSCKHHPFLCPLNWRKLGIIPSDPPMRSNIQGTLNPKHLFLGFFLLSILYIILRYNLSSSPYPPNTSSLQSTSSEETQANRPSTAAATATRPIQSCTKIPPSLANTIIHYATSNTTPQQTIKEISVTAQVLERRSPCNFLVFGLGRDSLMWTALNHGGRTVFLEEDRQWIEKIQQELPTLEAYHVKYDTKVSQAEELLELGLLPECTTVGDVRLSKCRLALKGLPEVFFEVEWDLIMVDAPTGYVPEAPGRMGAIYTAGLAARWRKEGETDVFVHDVNRLVEDRFSKKFLCEGYLRQEEGFLRHFTIPSHRSGMAMPFCPN